MFWWNMLTSTPISGMPLYPLHKTEAFHFQSRKRKNGKPIKEWDS